MKERSPATQLRYEKAESRKLRMMIGTLRSELIERRKCGQMMSNICFNLSQYDSYDAQHRQSMKDCSEMWAAIRRVAL